MHTGVDIVPPIGFKEEADLRPPASGIIEDINNSNLSDPCGLWVKIRVTKTMTIQMCHMEDEGTIKKLKKGEPVMPQTKLGVMGATGRVTGKHVHMIVYENGKVVDPTSQVQQFCKDPQGDPDNSRPSNGRGVST